MICCFLSGRKALGVRGNRVKGGTDGGICVLSAIITYLVGKSKVFSIKKEQIFEKRLTYGKLCDSIGQMVFK